MDWLYALAGGVNEGAGAYAEEQKKQRHQDLERLLQRYQNVKAELEAQQNLQRIRMEKLVQSGALTSKKPKKKTPGRDTAESHQMT